MALMKRPRTDLDMSEWFPTRRLFDWPTAWRELMEDTLRVEEFQDGDQLVVRAEMPGIDPDEDVEITVSDHMLHLTAERREEKRSEDKKGYRSEFRYGSFSRSVSLPTGATEDDVKATYNDGILEVRVPIDTAEVKARKIPVARS
ncbi:MAG: Hsp20/alpha crystallin family protein [Actinomycetota bacterium]|nr:Hsp20/alpha crystallin family protein [Actinomycetota bacterium]